MKKDYGIYFWLTFVLLQVLCSFFADFDSKFFNIFYCAIWLIIFIYSVYLHINKVNVKKVKYFVHDEIVDGFGCRVKFLCKNIDDTYMIRVKELKGNEYIYHFELDVLIKMGFIPTNQIKS